MDRADAALANALRRVNLSYARLPAEAQMSLPIWFDEFDRRIDETMLAGDVDAAVDAIKEFRDHWLAELEARR